jgi:sarcosine/dimethylglycine N-methyltransferase
MTDSVTQTARDYYNSQDADTFYFEIWGGEDIHIGLYESEREPIADASRRTVERMADMLPAIGPGTRVLDLGAGFGGAARQLVQKTGCHVTCLNLSERQNERNREMNEAAGLADKIEVLDGSFDTVPRPDETYDVVWSEDAFLHAPDREKVLREAYRVLKPGGSLIFTDPMQADDVPDGILQPVYDRIHLDSLASFAFYRKALKDIGFEEVEIVDLTEQLPRHYGRVREVLNDRYDEFKKAGFQDYADRMLQGLQHWVNFGGEGHLAWGIVHFRK